MTATNPDGGAAIPVSINTTRSVQGGAAIPVYGYASAPTDGRPAMGGAAIPVRVLTAADLKQNGGQWRLEGRPMAMPVYTAPATTKVMGGPALAVYPINAWPPSSTPAWVPSDLSGLILWLKSDVGLYKDAAKAQPVTTELDGVYTWADQSGNGNDCTQTTENNRPAYGPGLVSKPEAAFNYIDGAGTLKRSMTIPNGVSVTENNCTIVQVMRPISKALLAGYTVSACLGNALKLGYSPTGVCAVVNGGLAESTHAVYHQPGMIAITSAAGESKLWYNGAAESFGAGVGSTRTGGKIGLDGDGTSYPLYGTISETMIYNRPLTDAEMALLWTYVQSRYSVAATPTKQIIFDGDSLTTGYACLNHRNLPGQAWGILGSSWKFYNVAGAGQTLADMQSNAAAEIDPLYSAGLSKNIVVCWEGLLDVYYGADVATTLTRMETYCAARQAAGWQVVVLTCLPSNYISEADRTALNTGIRNNYAGWADALADIAADNRIGDAGDNTDATYYNNSDASRTHLTAAGFAIVASITAAAIQGL